MLTSDVVNEVMDVLSSINRCIHHLDVREVRVDAFLENLDHRALRRIMREVDHDLGSDLTVVPHASAAE
jgi:hypothetical protein